MNHSRITPLLAVTGEILLVSALSLGTVLVPSQPAQATVAAPALVSTVSAPTGVSLDSPWIADIRGVEWSYGLSDAGSGVLVSRNPANGSFATATHYSGDVGSIGAAYSAVSDVAVFSARRTGQGNRIIAFNLSTGSRMSSKSMALAEDNIRAIGFNSTGTHYIVGTNTSPAKIMKIEAASGVQQLSVTLSAGYNDVTAFVPNGTDLLAAVNSTPVRLVPVKSTTLTLGAATALPAGTPALLDPVVVGSTAYFGSEVSPGVITAVDIPTRTVLRSVTLNAGESGARHPVVDVSTGTLYVATETADGTRMVSFAASDLSRLGHVDRGMGSAVTSLSVEAHLMTVRYAGTRGIETLSVSPEPDAPIQLDVTELDRALQVVWADAVSAEPVVDYLVAVSADEVTHTCVTVETTCLVEGLRNGVDYRVSVVARSLAGTSTAATTTGNPYTIPDTPGVPVVTRGNGEVSVSWTHGTNGGRPIWYFTAVAEPSGRSCVTTESHCTIDRLSNGVAQTVRVTARSEAGDSLSSQPSETVTPATVPSVPTITATLPDETFANIAWEGAIDDGGDPVSHFRVTVEDNGRVVFGTTTNSTSATVTGLVPDTIYRIGVTACNSVGDGDTAWSEFTTLATPVVEPPVVDPPVVDPPVVDPPVVDPPVVDPPGPDIPDLPIIERVPGTPSEVVVLSQTRKRVTVAWTVEDAGSVPIVDFYILTSRFKDRGFRTIEDGESNTMRAILRKPRSGPLYVRIVAVNSIGVSEPSPSARVMRR